MSDAIKHSLVVTCRSMLRPVVSFLLKCGMSWREFAELSKTVFVEVSTAEYGIRGRPTNISRVALLTGMSRKEVKRQREVLAQMEPPPPNKTSDATRLLAAWHEDADFLGADGKPRELAIAGEGNEFPELCRRYASEVPTSAILKELTRVGAVSEPAAGKVSVLLRYYMPVQFDEQWLMNAGSFFADLGNNINYNLLAGEDETSRFLGRASEKNIDPDALPEFYRMIEDQGQRFLEEIDSWLISHRTAVSNGVDEEKLRLGVGLFLIQDEGREQ